MGGCDMSDWLRTLLFSLLIAGVPGTIFIGMEYCIRKHLKGRKAVKGVVEESYEKMV